MPVDKKSTHYDAGGIETIEVMKAKLTPQQFLGACLGECITHALRFNFKGDFFRDIEKIHIWSGIALDFLKQHPEQFTDEPFTPVHMFPALALTPVPKEDLEVERQYAEHLKRPGIPDPEVSQRPSEPEFDTLRHRRPLDDNRP